MKMKGSLGLIIVCLSMALIMLLSFSNCGGTPVPSSPAATGAPAPQTTAAAQVIKFKMQTNLPAGQDDYNWWKNDPNSFLNLVKEGSGGRLQIDMFGNGEIVPVPDELSATGKGVVDMMLCGSPYWAGTMPAALLGMLSFTLNDMQDLDSYLKPGFIDLMRPEYAKQNVQLLTIGYCGNGFLVSKKPINTLDDFKGLKVRVTGLPADILKTVGTANVAVGANELYTSLQSGIIDAGTFGGPVLMKSLRLNEVTKYVLLDPPVIALAFDVGINMDKYKALPNDLKWVLEKAATEGINNYALWGNINDSKALNFLTTSGGMQANRLSQAEKAKLSAAAMNYMSEYAKKDAVATKAYNQIKALMDAGVADR